MEDVIFGAGYIGAVVVFSAWSGEWSRRKGLGAPKWALLGAGFGPFALLVVALQKPKATLCPHCHAPILLDARYCPTCRTREETPVLIQNREALQGEMEKGFDGQRLSSPARDFGVLLPHGYFDEVPPQASVRPTLA